MSVLCIEKPYDLTCMVQCMSDVCMFQVAEISGSIATERFTGNQIRKIFEDHPAMYESTERIALVSSFMCSVLSGVYAPIDASDGAGMNLLDVNLLDWSPILLEATGPGLRSKLGAVVASTHVLESGLSRYYRERYGFSPHCKSVVWSGDNPCSLVGLGVTRPGSTAISLGAHDPGVACGRLGDALVVRACTP